MNNTIKEWEICFVDIDRILNFSSNAGKAMLQSGGETYRVEETITRICQSFGINHVDVFATPTAVMASVFVDGKLHSAIKRISSRRVDLNLVHEVNSLSRAISINNLDIELCEKILDEISEDNYYSDLITIFFAGIAAATFSILFGGNIEEFIATFTVGILTKFVTMYLSKSSLNDFFVNAIGAVIIAFCSIVILKLGFIKTLDHLIAGAIMLLVPGLALTNALRDLLDGQLISGLAKLAEVFFIGVSIAVGMFLVLGLYFKLGGI